MNSERVRESVTWARTLSLLVSLIEDDYTVMISKNSKSPLCPIDTLSLSVGKNGSHGVVLADIDIQRLKDMSNDELDYFIVGRLAEARNNLAQWQKEGE